MSIPTAAQCDTFVSFLESSSSFAELRLNLRLQVRYMLPLRGGGAVLRVLTRMQMTSLEMKTRETPDGRPPPPPPPRLSSPPSPIFPLSRLTQSSAVERANEMERAAQEVQPPPATMPHTFAIMFSPFLNTPSGNGRNGQVAAAGARLLLRVCASPRLCCDAAAVQRNGNATGK